MSLYPLEEYAELVTAWYFGLYARYMQQDFPDDWMDRIAEQHDAGAHAVNAARGVHAQVSAV